MSLADRASYFLSRPHFPWIAGCVAVLFTLPSVWNGVTLDDHFHRLAILEPDRLPGQSSSPMKLFSFVDGDPEHLHQAMDIGLFPWWTLETLRINFLRPLSALTYHFDYVLWPGSPAWIHLHSLLWYGLLVYLAAIAYRRIIGAGWVAGLAALLLAVDDAHAMTVGWLANRHALVAATFGLVAFLSHSGSKRDASKLPHLAGPLCFALSLLSAESGVATLAYIVSFAVCIDRRPWRARAIGLVPYGLILLVWRVAYSSLGYGALGSDFYVDPGREPLVFAATALERAPLYLLGQWAVPPAEVYTAFSSVARAQYLGAWFFLAVMVYVLFPLVRSSPVARFWALGMLFSIVPICAVVADNRNLMFVGFGAMGLLAQFVGAMFEQQAWLPKERVW